jgi:DNA-binding protein YbaB
MMESIKKAQELAKQTQVMQQEMMETTFVAQDTSGLISATFNGVGKSIFLELQL